MMAEALSFRADALIVSEGGSAPIVISNGGCKPEPGNLSRSDWGWTYGVINDKTLIFRIILLNINSSD